MTAQAMIVSSVEGPFTEQTWEFESPNVLWMLNYWKNLRGDRARPTWSDIDLLAIHKYARAMTVKDAIDDGADFLVRYWGTELSEYLKYDATGKRVSEYYPKPGLAVALETHQLALLGNTPTRRWGSSMFSDHGMMKIEMIHLPLDNDAGKPAHVITLSSFGWG